MRSPECSWGPHKSPGVRQPPVDGPGSPARPIAAAPRFRPRHPEPWGRLHPQSLRAPFTVSMPWQERRCKDGSLSTHNLVKRQQ